MAQYVKNITADVLISWFIFTWRETDYVPGQRGVMNRKLYYRHHLPPSEKQLLLSNSMGKSELCWFWRGPKECWNLGVYVKVRYCVQLLLSGPQNSLLKSALWGQRKSLYTVISCNILFLLPSFFTQITTCWLIPQCVLSEYCVLLVYLYMHVYTDYVCVSTPVSGLVSLWLH